MSNLDFLLDEPPDDTAVPQEPLPFGFIVGDLVEVRTDDDDWYIKRHYNGLQGTVMDPCPSMFGSNGIYYLIKWKDEIKLQKRAFKEEYLVLVKRIVVTNNV